MDCVGVYFDKKNKKKEEEEEEMMMMKVKMKMKVPVDWLGDIFGSTRALFSH